MLKQAAGRQRKRGAAYNHALCNDQHDWQRSGSLLGHPWVEQPAGTGMCTAPRCRRCGRLRDRINMNGGALCSTHLDPCCTTPVRHADRGSYMWKAT